LAGSVLSHLGIEITTKELGSQRSFSKVMNVLKKNASQWEAFFVSASCKKVAYTSDLGDSYKVPLR
ncbi:hypothetical protein P3620_25240, partial [Vibrio parahaemolyticus]|nr:hypothetical protein [Vibrio parahaemolyticus]